MAFPTLSTEPDSFSLTPVDNSVYSTPEAGLPLARRRFSRQLYTISLGYPALLDADTVALKGHFDTVSTSTSFSFTYKTVPYTVRYRKLQIDEIQSNNSASIIMEII